LDESRERVKRISGSGSAFFLSFDFSSFFDLTTGTSAFLLAFTSSAFLSALVLRGDILDCSSAFLISFFVSTLTSVFFSGLNSFLGSGMTSFLVSILRSSFFADFFPLD